MERSELLHRVAPCSLLCHTCPGLADGAVAQSAGALCGYFEGYYEFNEANLPAEYRGWLKEFAAFSQRLEKYAHPGCPGCRDNPAPGKGCIEGCVPAACTRERGLDFCADCPDFPCEKARVFFDGLNGVIGDGWETGSRRLRQVGLEAFFAEKKGISHYISWKKARE